MTQEIKIVPGTATLFETTNGETRVLLVPRPSSTDPNDPLRWAVIRKNIVIALACFYAFMGSVTGPIMSAGMLQLSKSLNTSLQRVTYTNGATLICQGVATTIWMPFAIKYGRRPVYLLSNLLMGVACMWCGMGERSYGVLLSGRAMLGVWEAPIESIVPSTITDLIFLHQRGAYLSIYGMSVLGGNELGPLFSGFIIQAMSVKWAFWIVGMIILVAEIPIFFFMPETKFHRDHEDEVPELVAEKAVSLDQDESQTFEVPVKTYSQSLKFWSKADPHTPSLLKLFPRPFFLLAYPTVVWSCLIYGLSLSWNVVMGVSVAQIFGPPPYNFDSQYQGLTFVSPLIGSLVGTYLCGPLSDRIANYYTKRNGGVREPEMRLPTCLIAACFTTIGALTVAIPLHYHTHWAVPIVGLGIAHVGAQMGATLAMSYSLDCHKELSAELMVTVAAVKSAIAWIWTWVFNDLIDRRGAMAAFLIIGGANLFGYLFTIPLYLRGKSIRIWIAEKQFLRSLT